MTIRGIDKKGRTPENRFIKTYESINIDNAQKTLKACLGKLENLGFDLLPLRFKPISTEQVIEQLEICSRLVATTASNFLATDINSIKTKKVSHLIQQLIKIVDSSLASYSTLVTHLSSKKEKAFGLYLVQFVEMATELTAAFEEKLGNKDNKNWRISQHPDSFDAAIGELNHLDKSIQNRVNQPNTVDSDSNSNRWSDWSYAIDSIKSIDSENEPNSTLVIKSEIFESADNFFNPQTMFIKTDENLHDEKNNQSVVLDNLTDDPTNEIIDTNNTSTNKSVNALLKDYFDTALQEQWQKINKRSFFNPRSNNTKVFDTTLRNVVNDEKMNEEDKLKSLIAATEQWLNNEANKKSLVKSPRTKKIINLKRELENKLYLIQIKSNSENTNNTALEETLEVITKLVHHAETKMRGGFKKIANEITNLRHNSNPEQPIEQKVELFRKIQKIAEDRLAGKKPTTFFAKFTRKKTVKEIYQALTKAELFNTEKHFCALNDLKEELAGHLPKNNLQ